MKKSSIIIVSILIINLIMLPMISIAAFYDTKYPPNSSGRADYTDKEAEIDQQRKEKELPTSDDYVGKSSNNYLKSLRVENATMEPEFHRQYIDYKLTLENETTKKIKVIAEAEDEKATIQGTGEIEIQDGINDIRVIVTAENGNVQIYSLLLETPFKQSNLKLENLKIDGVNIGTGKNEKGKIRPDFQPEIYEYEMEVNYEITSLDIQAQAPQDVYLLIEGENDLEVGQNRILIILEDAKDENKRTTYTIHVNRQEKKEQNNWKVLIPIGIIIAIMASIGMIVIQRKKK